MANSNFSLDWSDLETPIDQIEVKHGGEREQFPCQACGGSGLYRGVRVHQEKRECFACRGRGYFLTSPQARAKAKASAQRRKAEGIAAVQLQNLKAAEGLFDDLQGMADWNSFAASMVQQHGEGKRAWSEKQINAALAMVEKVEAKRKARLEARAAEAVSVDLSPIATMFEAATDSGYKKPVYRAEGVVISKAPMHGANAGALYVKDSDGEYLGKVADGKFWGIRGIDRATVEANLKTIAADPKEAAVRWGKKYGKCSCCGRDLTNKVSIELGIGPICAEKWGL